MIEAGELDAHKDERSGQRRVSQVSVHALLEDLPPRQGDRGTAELEEPSTGGKALRLRVETLQRELGRMEGRLELTEVTESTLRESLERERERADRLEAELEKARRSWWQRIFGRTDD